MVALALILLALLLGGLLGKLVLSDTGYVLINYGPFVIETSVWVFLVGLLSAYVLLRLLLLSWRYVLGSQGRWLRWRSHRKLQQARERTIRGTLLMAEGRWAEAKRLFLQGVDDIETPYMNYLHAAAAAHELGGAEERDELLEKAEAATPGSRFATLLTRAQYLTRDHNYEAALAILLKLRDRAPKLPRVLSLLATCYEALEDWDALHTLLKELAAHKVVNATELARLSKLVWRDLLAQSQQAAALWKKMPDSLQQDQAFLSQWVDDLEARGLADEAEQALRLILQKHWQAEFVRRYGCVVATDAKRQLQVVQGWRKAHPDQVDVELALGRLQLRNGMFEQARESFEGALRLAPRDEIYAELGRLCIALGDERRGADYLLKSSGWLPALPQPESPVMRSAQPG